MNILKKSIAPITDKAWEEIELQSSRVFNQYLAGRKIANVNGPNGIDYGAVSTGRLIVPKEQPKEGINYGIREVIPLIEVRKPFTLDMWELDNASRNAKDLDLRSLEKAAKQVAAFEDNCLFYGFKEFQLPGLLKANKEKPVEVNLDANDFIRIIVSQVADLKKQSVEGPYSLILPDDVWSKLVSLTPGYPVLKQLKAIIKGSIITHHFNKEIFLVSERGGDIELVLGQDLSLGYDGHDTDTIKLYFTESFVYRVLSPESVKVLTAA